MSRWPQAVVVATLSVLVGACAETTVDPIDPVDTTTAVAASTTVPVGTTDELLDRLIAEATALSERVVEGEGEDEALARIEALWSSARPGIEDGRPELLEQFEEAMDYARRAVDRRRPADADKAAQNLRTLADAL